MGTGDEVRRLTGDWRRGPAVHVVADASSLPRPCHPDTMGLFWEGSVFIVDGAAADVAPIVMHEAIAHYGLRELLGPRGWSNFMIAVSDGINAGDAQLYRVARHVRQVYGPDMRPKLRADEVIARVVEVRTDARTGRLRIDRPLLKRAAALRGRIARELLHYRHPATLAEVEGALLEAEALIRAGRCSTVPWRRWYRRGMSKPMGAKNPPRSWQQSKDWLEADKRRGEWFDQVTLTALGIFFAVAIPLWFVYMGWSTFDTLHWFFGH